MIRGDSAQIGSIISRKEQSVNITVCRVTHCVHSGATTSSQNHQNYSLSSGKYQDYSTVVTNTMEHSNSKTKTAPRTSTFLGSSLVYNEDRRTHNQYEVFRTTWSHCKETVHTQNIQKVLKMTRWLSGETEGTCVSH